MKFLGLIILCFSLYSCGGSDSSGDGAASNPYTVNPAYSKDAKAFTSNTRWCSSIRWRDDKNNTYTEEYTFNENQEIIGYLIDIKDNTIVEEVKGVWGIQDGQLKALINNVSQAAVYFIEYDYQDRVDYILIDDINDDEGNEIWTPCGDFK
jgi:uncharacterized membrane protein